MTKKQSRADRLSNAIGNILNAKDDIEMLKDEIESWKDNLEGTNLEYTFKYEQLEECYGVLEELIDELDNTISREDEVIFPSMF